MLLAFLISSDELVNLTAVLFRCYYAFIPSYLYNCSSVWGSTINGHLQFLVRPGRLIAGLCPHQLLMRLIHRPCVDRLFLLFSVYIVQSYSNPRHWIYGEQPISCQRRKATFAAVAAHPYKFAVPRCTGHLNLQNVFYLHKVVFGMISLVMRSILALWIDLKELVFAFSDSHIIIVIGSTFSVEPITIIIIKKFNILRATCPQHFKSYAVKIEFAPQFLK